MHAASAELLAWFAESARAGRLAHSYLLVSKDGVSLEAAARDIQKELDGAHRSNLADGLAIEPEGTSIGIDAAREAREHLAAFPGIADWRTALVLHAELLTAEAQNALLKVAEEPAERSVLILAATDEERLLPTLRSRLQRVPVPPLAEADVATWLVARGASEQEAARIAGQSGGSLALAAELSEETPARGFAQQLLTAPASQAPAIAKAAAADEVALTDLLRALSAELAYTQHTARDRELWHRTQRLLAAAQGSPLSLRLQVAALFADLPAS